MEPIKKPEIAQLADHDLYDDTGDDFVTGLEQVALVDILQKIAAAHQPHA